MSWPYWGIVIGLTAMVIMLIACIRLLSFDDPKERQRSRQGGPQRGESCLLYPAPHRLCEQAFAQTVRCASERYDLSARNRSGEGSCPHPARGEHQEVLYD